MQQTNVLLWILCFMLAACQQITEKPTRIAVPGSGKTENRAARREWERQMLADPATGRIPDGIRFLERRFVAGLPVQASPRSGDGAWEARGPWNYGGRTRALAFDVNDENRIFAGGVSGGLWLSEDGGQSWTRRTPMNAHPGCVSIAQHTQAGKTHVWYYLSGEIYGTSASGGSAFYLGDGMFKSTDNGLTWAPLSSTDGGNPQSFTNIWQGGWRVATDPSADSTQEIVYAATYGAIWRSANGGQSWTAVRGGGAQNAASYFTDVALTSQGVVYATLSSEGFQGGIWRSPNGAQWTRLNPPGFPTNYQRFVIGINPDNENEVYFLGYTPNAGLYSRFIDSDEWNSLWKYTYLSGDGSGDGGQWVNLSANLPATGTDFDRFASQGGYDLTVKVQPGTGHVFIGGTSLWRSTDGFTTPDNTAMIGGYMPGTKLPYFEIYPNHHPDVHELLFLPSNPKVLFTASDGGVHRSDDPLAPNVVWTSLNNGYLTTQFYTALFDRNTPGDQTIIGGFQDNGNLFVNSDNPQASWVQTINGDGAYGAVRTGKDFYILSIQQGRIAKATLDNQGVVTAFQRFDPADRRKNDYLFINPLAIDPLDENLLYLPAGRHLYRHNNLSAIPLLNQWDSTMVGWTKFPDTLVAQGGQFTAIGVSRGGTPHRLYVGTSQNRIYRIDNAHTGAPNWTQLPAPLTNNGAYVSCIAVDPNDADRVILCYSNYSIYSIFLTENGGQSWIRVAGNLEQLFNGAGAGPSIRWISILPLPNGQRRYYCGTSAGLFAADTLIQHTVSQPGTQWVLQAPETIGAAVVPYVDVRPSDGLVLAATHGNGLFTTYADVSIATHDKPSASAPTLRLAPNPATHFALLQWDNPGPARLRVFDAQGRSVFEKNVWGGGETLDLNDLKAGIYFCELSGIGWRLTTRLIKAGR
ncbi:MAG: T9SS type A sorting domain-containing protein [Saprospiraceae bacterium]